MRLEINHSVTFHCGMRCPGLAAGFDKDGEVIEPMMGLGLGFVEIGEQKDD